MMGKGLVDKLKKSVATALVGAVMYAPMVRADSLDIHLKNEFTDSRYSVASDDFHAFYDSDNPTITNGFDAEDVKQAYTTESNAVQIYTINSHYVLTEDGREYAPNETDEIMYDIKLMAQNEDFSGLSGSNRVTLMNPSELDYVPSGYNLFIDRYNEGGDLEETIDLCEPTDFTGTDVEGRPYIEWSENNALGNYSNLKLRLQKDTNPWDFNDDGKVNLIDYATFAQGWGTTYDTDDLVEFSENWLWERGV